MLKESTLVEHEESEDPCRQSFVGGFFQQMVLFPRPELLLRGGYVLASDSIGDQRVV